MYKFKISQEMGIAYIAPYQNLYMELNIYQSVSHQIYIEALNRSHIIHNVIIETEIDQYSSMNILIILKMKDFMEEIQKSVLQMIYSIYIAEYTELYLNESLFGVNFVNYTNNDNNEYKNLLILTNSNNNHFKLAYYNDTLLDLNYIPNFFIINNENEANRIEINNKNNIYSKDMLQTTIILRIY